MQKVIQTALFDIVIDGDPVGASITSTLHEADTDENSLYNAAIDGLESLVLAHYCAGIDVTSSEYIEGVETAAQAIGNNID